MPQTNTPPSPSANMIDDIDLDELSKEEEVEKKQAVVQPAVKDEIDFDDEEFLKDLGMAAPAKSKSPLPPIDDITTEKAAATSDEKTIADELFEDIDLDDLDDIEKKMSVDHTADKLEQSNDREQNQATEPLKIKEEIAPIPTQNSIIQSINGEIETILQNQNFSEIAMNILEPKLDSWLDQHLHGLVEKIVQEEVKKLFEKR